MATKRIDSNFNAQRQAAINAALAHGYLRQHENHAGFTLGLTPVEKEEIVKKDWVNLGWDLISEAWNVDAPLGVVFAFIACIISSLFTHTGLSLVIGLFFLFYPITFGITWVTITLPAYIKRLTVKYVFKMGEK